jgi:hypothetical protein
MAYETFIPQLWSAMIIRELRKSLVYAGLCNRDWEGEITGPGASVKIGAIGPVTVGNYTQNTDMSDPQILTDANTVLVIDQAKYFNFAVDDIDRRQGKLNKLTAGTDDAAYRFADAADQYVAGLMWADVPTANTIGTNAAAKSDLGTAGKLYEYLVDLDVILSENNVPTTGRWVVLPPWAHGLLQKDSRFVANGTGYNVDILQNGRVQRTTTFNVQLSNNCPKTSATSSYKIIAGTSLATTMADQIVQVEAFRMEKRFSDAVKGLYVYGAKVIRPQALAVLFADRPS